MIIPVRMLAAAARHAERVTVALLQCKAVAVGEAGEVRVEAWHEVSDLTGYLAEPKAVSLPGAAARAVAKALAGCEVAELAIEGELKLMAKGVTVRARATPVEPPVLREPGKTYLAPLRIAYLWCRKHPHARIDVRGEGRTISVGPVAIEAWDPVEPFAVTIVAGRLARAYESLKEWTNPEWIGATEGHLVIRGATAAAWIEVVEG